MTHTNCGLAKHLEQLKGGRFPIEVLVRGKDAAENEKLFVKLTDKIKEAGVSSSYLHAWVYLTIAFVEQGWHNCQRHLPRALRRRVEEGIRRTLQGRFSGRYLSSSFHLRFRRQG